MAIDVGASCTNRADDISSGFTVPCWDNPANATGTIDTVCIYVEIAMSGIEFASFIDEGSNETFSTNGDTNGSNLSGGSGEQTFTAAGCDFTAFNIATGEYIGIYYSDGKMDNDDSGGVGYSSKSGDYIPCTSEGSFTTRSGRVGSLYGTGTEAGAVAKAVAGSLVVSGALARKVTFKRAVAGAL